MKKVLLFCLLLIGASCSKPVDVAPKPVANFTYTTVNTGPATRRVVLTNTSTNATRYQWQAGTLAETTKDFQFDVTENGRVNVSLTAKGDGGEDTKVQSIDIADIPTTGQINFWTQIGNAGNIVVTVDGTQRGTITQYITNGVAPACNQQGFVTVDLPAGSHTISARSGTGLTWSGTFTVSLGQCLPYELRR